MPTPPLPTATTRWRCTQCGNLTRFDVTRTRRTREFWHFDLAGDHVVEDIETLAETLEAVTCRWCGRTDTVEVVARADVDTDGASDRTTDRASGRATDVVDG